MKFDGVKSTSVEILMSIYLRNELHQLDYETFLKEPT